LSPTALQIVLIIWHAVKYIRSNLKKPILVQATADATVEPEVPAQPMPIVVNTPVFREVGPPYH